MILQKKKKKLIRSMFLILVSRLFKKEYEETQ